MLIWRDGNFDLRHTCFLAERVYGIRYIREQMWTVLIGDEFEPEFLALPPPVQDETLAMTRLLQQFGPQPGRPRVDTLKGSRHANMKELRFDAADGTWRIAFAFDPKRQAILLVAGTNQAGVRRGFTAS